MQAQITAQQRHINTLQNNQAKHQETAIRNFEKLFKCNIMALTPQQIRKIKRQRQRLQAKAFRQKQRQSQV